MTTLAVLGNLLTIGTALVAIISHVELWQRKEYRWDRVRASLRSPEISLRALPLFSTGVALVALGWIALSTFQFALVEVFGWLSLLSFAAHYGLCTFQRGLIRPVFTIKAITNLVLTTLISLVLLLTHYNFPLGLASVIFFIPLLTAAVVGLVNIPFWLKKRAIIRHAAQKRQRLATLTVIGITGSFGKTSTKHFLYTLLAAVGKKSLASAEHRNAELPIAQDILARLTPATELYVVEAAAYRRGEVAAVARLTQPRLGILTVLGNQHLDLFGSIENIVTAKWELIASLPANGVAILNADDPKQVTQASAHAPRCPIVWYSTQKPAGVWTEKVVMHPTHLTARLHAKSAIIDVELPLASEALLQGVVAAVAAATALGFSLSELQPHLAQLKPYPRTMELKQGTRGATIIDDSYSANEAGVLVALRHLQRFLQPHKIVVLLPLIELGHQSKAVHERIGAALAKSGTHVYLYNRGEIAALKSGAAQADPYFHMHVYSDPTRLAAKLKDTLTADSVILLEGRLPDVVRDSVL